MLISDILSNAARQIEECKGDFEDLYNDPDLSAWIDRVVAEMESLRKHLDSPWQKEHILKNC